MTSLELGHMDEAPRVDCPSVPCNEADRGILSRQMDVDRQMLITAERDGYFGLRAKPALGSFVSIRG